MQEWFVTEIEINIHKYSSIFSFCVLISKVFSCVVEFSFSKQKQTQKSMAIAYWLLELMKLGFSQTFTIQKKKKEFNSMCSIWRNFHL